MSDKTAGDVREAVLGTLGLLITKASQNLKPFVPQLQTTFSKSLADQVSPGPAHRENQRSPYRGRHRSALSACMLAGAALPAQPG